MVSVDDRPARGLKLLAARLDARSVRERALAFVVALALVLGGWDGLLLAPLDTRRAALQQQVPDLETRLATLDTLTAQLLTERQRDPDAVPRAELDRLRRAAGRLDTLLVELTERLVPPRHMAPMLESVLTRETDLTLTRLAGLGLEPLDGEHSVGGDAVLLAAGADHCVGHGRPWLLPLLRRDRTGGQSICGGARTPPAIRWQ